MRKLSGAEGAMPKIESHCQTSKNNPPAVAGRGNSRVLLGGCDRHVVPAHRERIRFDGLMGAVDELLLTDHWSFERKSVQVSRSEIVVGLIVRSVFKVRRIFETECHRRYSLPSAHPVCPERHEQGNGKGRFLICHPTKSGVGTF